MTARRADREEVAMHVVFRRDAEKGLAPHEHVIYELQEGATVNHVVVGKIGPDNVPLHSHEEEEYWFILTGRGTAVVGDQEFEVEAGDLVLTPAGVKHTLHSEEGMTELSFMVRAKSEDSHIEGLNA